jgi:hypothetical protein
VKIYDGNILLVGKYVGKHAAPAGPEGRAARRELRARWRRESRAQRWSDAWRFGVTGIPVAIAGGFMDQTDVPWLLHPVLIAFGALLPMAVIGIQATAAVNAIAQRRAQRLATPRPRLCYLFFALGWAVAAAVFRLLGWAAGGGPDGTGDWIVTAVGWAFMISACAALMMITRAVTVRNGSRPFWLARLRTPPPSS